MKAEWFGDELYLEEQMCMHKKCELKIRWFVIYTLA